MGCFIGITGCICDERMGGNLKISLDLKANTRRNELVILKTISKCLNKEGSKVAEIVTRNTKKFFSI